MPCCSSKTAEGEGQADSLLDPRDISESAAVREHLCISSREGSPRVLCIPDLIEQDMHCPRSVAAERKAAAKTKKYQNMQHIDPSLPSAMSDE